MRVKPTFDQRAALFQRMIYNTRMVAENGVIGSSETILNKKTRPYLGAHSSPNCERNEMFSSLDAPDVLNV